MNFDDTICAIATPPGQGAIGIIRLSGPDTLKICDAISPKKKLSDKGTHTIHFCKISDNDEVIDEVLISVFKSPNSYTSEDVAEISCHGSSYILQKIIELLLKHGARMAKPGEFTMRAFLNGKLDLSQAEAVADLIHSTSKAGHDTAINQMRGGFSRELAILRDQLLQFASLIELELDFSDEDVEFADREDLKKNVNTMLDKISKLVNSFSYGNVIKNGIPVAIIGQPNVGKSTLLNTLLNEEKAIVSEIPGTTRDVIEDSINIQGYQFRFIDTAGIRHTDDHVESIGIGRTFDNIKKASIILLLIDASAPLSDLDEQLKKIQLSENQKLLILLNKVDKGISNGVEDLVRLKGNDYLKISAKHHINIHEIHQFLLNSMQFQHIGNNDIIVTNARHYEALLNSLEAGKRVLSGLDAKIPGDLLAQDLREVLYHLGTITGEITTDEILGNIFKNFCIGK